VVGDLHPPDWTRSNLETLESADRCVVGARPWLLSNADGRCIFCSGGGANQRCRMKTFRTAAVAAVRGAERRGDGV